MFYLNKYIFCMCSKYRVIIPTNKKNRYFLSNNFKFIIYCCGHIQDGRQSGVRETDGTKDFIK